MTGGEGRTGLLTEAGWFSESHLALIRIREVGSEDEDVGGGSEDEDVGEGLRMRIWGRV